MTIEQRVAKLERQNRWLKRGGGLALAAVACVFLIGQGKAKRLPDLVAQSLTIKDPAGKRRIFLYTGDRGHAIIHVNDKDGITRLEATVNPDGSPFIQLSGPMTGPSRPLLVLMATSKRSFIKLHQRQHQPARVTIETLDDGTPSIELRGKTTYRIPPK